MVIGLQRAHGKMEACKPSQEQHSIVDSNTTVDWNIVETYHDVLMDNSGLPAGNGGNRSVLGLFVESNELTVDGNNASGTGYGITVTHYLTMDGDIDLEGESQLIQTTGSDLDVTSSGLLERDQQGTADTYTYNYWSSPVGISNTTTNNNSYTLPDVMRDGTQNITWLTSGYDGANTTPISIADYWIWKFANQLDDEYSAWQHVRSTGTMYAGEGFTMKGPGSGAILDDQNYVFIGKTNNGDIDLTISGGNDYLVGNPYPSAIDAQQFILDNGSIIAGTGATTGTLYFWEHWGGGNHNLQDYLGGYATYNLSGGTPSASMGTNDPDVGTGGTPTKTPGRYIPVSQGFFVVAEGSGGTINFNNGQRVFSRESDGNSIFVEANPAGATTLPGGGNNTSANNSNADNGPTANYNEDPGDTRMKMRIGFNSVNTIRRQLLLTVDANATMGIDWAYDGKLNEDQMDDFYWLIDNEKYIIQGVDNVDTETIFPLGVVTENDGTNTITLDVLRYVPEDLHIFVHDMDLDIYHNLKLSDYEIYLPAGTYDERFELVFSHNESLDLTDNELSALDVHYSNAIESIVVVNPTFKHIKSIEMFNVLGQSIYTVDHVSETDYAEYKVSNLSSGTYIIKLNTEFGTISKKVLVE